MLLGIGIQEVHIGITLLDKIFFGTPLIGVKA